MEIDLDYEFDLGLGYVPPVLTWPTISGITEEQAEKVCSDEITNSNVYELCKDFINMPQMITACTHDIKVTVTLMLMSLS